MNCKHCNKVIKEDPAYWKANVVCCKCYYKLWKGHETIEEPEKVINKLKVLLNRKWN